MDRKIVKYNPAFLSDQDLIDGFVVRLTEFDLITEIVRENTTESNQHILVIGPRGSGKTTLVRRVAAEIRRDKALQKQWYPIFFGEESYMVSTPGEFWLEAIFHLAFQTKDKQWKKLYEELKEESSEDRLREKALAQLLDFADAEGKRLVLVVENLHQLLGDQISDEDAWVLRKTLLHERRIMLLGTSVGPFWTGSFEEVENEGKAMFELFKKIELESLTDTQCKILWESVTGKEAEDYCIRPINILTGGNPRLVMIISRFGADLSFKNLLEDLLKLVDENTEYFKSHLDNLSAQERKVYLSLAEIWDPATAKQVSDQARLAVNTTSTILGRLENRGAVSVVIQEGRKKFYQIAERMYNIYYLMRRRGGASGRVKAAVRFIASFYDKKELIDILKAIANEACELECKVRESHCSAFMELYKQIGDERIQNRIINEVSKSFLIMPEIINGLLNLDDSDVRNWPEWKINITEAVRLFCKGIITDDKSMLNEAKQIFDSVKIPDNENGFNGIKAFLEGYLGNTPEAKKLFEQSLSIDPNNKYTLWAYGQILNNEFNDYEKAEEYLLKAIDIDHDFIQANAELVRVYLNSSEYQKAIHPIGNLLSIFPQDSQLYLTRALLNMSLEDNEVAIRDLNIVINIKGHPTIAHGYLGMLFLLTGRIEEAMKEVSIFINDFDSVKENPDFTTGLFVRYASKGFTAKALDILDKSEAKKLLEPLVVGLRMYLGQDVKVAEEIKEVAKDVVKRIQETKAENEQEGKISKK